MDQSSCNADAPVHRQDNGDAILNVDEVLTISEAHGGLVGVLTEASDADRAALYDAMGVTAVFDPETVEAPPCKGNVIHVHGSLR